VFFPAVQAAAVDGIARDALASYQTPGVSIAVVRDGRTVRVTGFGARDCGGGGIPGPHTRFAIGSLTKQFVATLALQLVQKKALDLDAPLTRYLPEDRNWSAIAIRSLLDQRSGIADFNGPWFLARHLGAVWPGRVDRPAIVAGLESEPREFPADARFEYSNANYLVLGTILERVAKRPLGTLLRAGILVPLHLHDTGFGVPSGSDAAAGCGTTPWGVSRVPSFDPQLTWAAGGMYSSAADMAAFETALLGAKLLTARSLSTMLTARDGYAFGWYVYPNGSDRIAWHDGTVLGYKSAVVAVPTRRDLVVVLSNADYFHAARVATEVADAALGTTLPVAEGFDAALPRASLAIGAIAGFVPIVLALWFRRRIVFGIAGGIAAYACASLAWPAAIAVGAVVAILTMTGRTKARR